MKFYLNFVSPNFGKIEITEPIGFDAYSFKLSQRKDGFGRDKNIGAEQIDLQFISGYFEKANEPRTQPNGVVINNLTMCFDEILQAISEHGSESKIEFFVNNFNNGLLDISESTTDNIKYFSCSIVQDTTRALIERKKDIKTDVFGFVDTFGNGQTPLAKTKILLKAKPTIEKSVFRLTNTTINILGGFGGVRENRFNFINEILNFGIEDTLSYIPGTGQRVDFAYIEAKNALSKLKLTLDLDLTVTMTGSGGGQFLVLKYYIGTSLPNTGSFGVTILETQTSTIFNYNDTIIVDNLNIQNGQKLWIWFEGFVDTGNATVFMQTTVRASSITVEAVATSVNSVIFGVPYFDFLQQGIKSISNLQLEANEIETGSFKDQFIFNGNLIRQKENNPLNFVFKDEMNDLKETNSDYQILDNKVQILQYPDFYPNIDIGAFNISPDESVFARKYNDRFKDFSLEYNYNNFEDDKDESNTVDAVHTEAQFQHANEQVDNNLEVSINHIRDPFLIERMRRDALKNTTALSTDDKIVLLDCVAIPENSQGNFTAVLKMRVVSGNIEILGTSTINWLLLGFENGNTITISGPENAGSYLVSEHEATLIKLIPINFNPIFSGDVLITFTYPLTGVNFTNRTNEGFNIISGVSNPDDFANLKYTIRRNLSRDSWSSYLATINKDVPNGAIRNTYFKNNGELLTQFENEELIKESENFKVFDLSTKILNKHEITTKIAIGFETAKQLIEDIASLKGFVRILDPNNKMYKIHPKMVDMVWRDGVMEITGEERNESDFVVIFKNETITINEVGYTEVISLLEWFRFTGEYLQIFDQRSIPLMNPTKFNKVILNGVTYNSPTALAIALNN